MSTQTTTKTPTHRPPVGTPPPSPYNVVYGELSRPKRGIMSQTRYQFAAYGLVIAAIAVITLLQAVNAYQTSYNLFRGIVEVNSTTVDASERALQYIAQASQAAADYALLSSDTPLFEQAQNNIFRDFSSFRDELAIVGDHLQTDAERSAFIVAETITYSRFWRHVSNLVAQRTNEEVARGEYLEADNHVRSWINPALERLELLNFQQMIDAANNAGGNIRTQVFLFAVPAFALILMLVFHSIRIRQTVRRYITPGIDAALVLSIIVTVVILLQLLGAPSKLEAMTQRYYQNVSASSRTLVDANLANRAESSAMIDLSRLDAWNTRFDDLINRIELRLCGQADCTQETFVVGNTSNLTTTTINRAQNISSADSTSIDSIAPLAANVSNDRERQALEEARVALKEYRAVHNQIVGLLQTGDVASAVTLNTQQEPGTSQAAFDRFTTAMNDISQVNRTAFDQIWDEEGVGLRANQILFAFAGFALIGVLALVGTLHRVREL
ncbi:MAG: hypothetical protein U0670_01635 [Anaerolineae bacterium]